MLLAVPKFLRGAYISQQAVINEVKAPIVI
jgi:hypothetical protein